MKIQQIRNAALRISCAGKTFLTDPWLGDRGSLGTFAEKGMRCCRPEQEHLPMPMCDLPIPAAEVLKGIDACIVTHIHPDHIDMAADGTVGGLLPRHIPVFVQSSEDADVLRHSGFEQIHILSEESFFGDIQLVKTPGLHGTKKPCGPSCGVVFRHPSEPVLYLAGDTIWYEGVADTLTAFSPDIVVLNACAAELSEYGRLIMDDRDVQEVCKASPNARIIVSHMDTVAHATISRKEMRERLLACGLADRVLMPDDGEMYDFPRCATGGSACQASHS